jgi:hypothetical protein
MDGKQGAYVPKMVMNVKNIPVNLSVSVWDCGGNIPRILDFSTTGDEWSASCCTRIVFFLLLFI